MPEVGTRVLEKTLSHLSTTLEQAEQAHISQGVTGWFSVDARVKVIGAFLLTIAAVTSKRLAPVGCLLICLTALALFSHITWKRLATAWTGGLFFASLVAVPAFFTAGWNTAFLLVGRSEASLTCWLIVVMTTPFHRILRALRALYVPSVAVAILSMTFRYIFLLVQTAQDMLLSRRSRIVGLLSGAENRSLMISATGVLLDKSVQMSEDVYHAMTSRGFRGNIFLLDDFSMKTYDWLALAAILLISTLLFVAGR